MSDNAQLIKKLNLDENFKQKLTSLIGDQSFVINKNIESTPILPKVVTRIPIINYTLTASKITCLSDEPCNIPIAPELTEIKQISSGDMFNIIKNQQNTELPNNNMYNVLMEFLIKEHIKSYQEMKDLKDKITNLESINNKPILNISLTKKKKTSNKEASNSSNQSKNSNNENKIVSQSKQDSDKTNINNSVPDAKSGVSSELPNTRSGVQVTPPDSRSVVQSALPDTRSVVQSALPDTRSVVQSALPDARSVVHNSLSDARLKSKTRSVVQSLRLEPRSVARESSESDGSSDSSSSSDTSSHVRGSKHDELHSADSEIVETMSKTQAVTEFKSQRRIKYMPKESHATNKKPLSDMKLLKMDFIAQSNSAKKDKPKCKKHNSNDIIILENYEQQIFKDKINTLNDMLKINSQFSNDKSHKTKSKNRKSDAINPLIFTPRS
jgi:hypothetical protein